MKGRGMEGKERDRNREKGGGREEWKRKNEGKKESWRRKWKSEGGREEKR